METMNKDTIYLKIKAYKIIVSWKNLVRLSRDSIPISLKSSNVTASTWSQYLEMRIISLQETT